MNDLSGLILLLLPMAAAAGWFAARHSRRPEERDAGRLNPDYVRGLSHLVNNDTDQAIEVFIGMLEADSATIELHLALGSLFRRRGEVDRALRVHHNLVQRPQLAPLHRNQARYELAKDYLSAGVLDRAEEIFQELANQGMFLGQSLRRLMRLFEQEREWDRAIDTARWLASAEGRELGPVIAQYYCEKAEAARRAQDAKATQQALKKALAADPHCVRAQLIRAELARQAGEIKAALRAYRDIIRHHPEFLAEVLGPLQACFAPEEHTAWLAELEGIYRNHPQPQLQLALYQARQQQGQDALAALLQDLSERPSWVGLHAAMSQDWPSLDAGLRKALHELADNLAVPLKRSPRYRCHQCGYSALSLNWQCPSCRQWNTTRPLTDMSYAALDTAAHSASAVS